jgi:hypothetical protein
MIGNLDRIIKVLDTDIATEEERARIFDRSDALYPILARTLMARRDNLKLTVAALEQRLAAICATLPQVTTARFQPMMARRAGEPSPRARRMVGEFLRTRLADLNRRNEESAAVSLRHNQPNLAILTGSVR